MSSASFARAADTLPWPGSYLARELHQRTRFYRFVIQPFVYHDWIDGVGTFEAFCPQRRLYDWHKDSISDRAQTCFQAMLGAAAQSTVWLYAGVVAGVLAGLVALRDGRTAANIFMAEHYVPMMFTIMVVTTATYVACLIGSVFLLKNGLRGLS